MELEPGSRIDIVSDQPMRLAALDGTTTVVLSPGEPVSIPASLLSQALAAGARTVNGENSAFMSEEDIIAALKEAMADILNEGDPAHVTGNGEPRYASLKARCPEFTKEQREMAWEEYVAEYIASPEPTEDVVPDTDEEDTDESWEQ
jgi:hypothetical protein